MHPGADSSQLRSELALMRMFRHLDIPADVFLTAEEIERQWARCGVRRTDLPGAIERLVRRGLLARRADAPDLIACTVAGSNWLDEQPGWLEYHLLVPRMSRAHYLRASGESFFRGPRRRRVGERLPRHGSP